MSNSCTIGLCMFLAKNSMFGAVIAACAAVTTLGNVAALAEFLKVYRFWPVGRPEFSYAFNVSALKIRPKYIPYPPRRTVLPSPKGSYANPSLGPILFLSLGLFAVPGYAGLITAAGGPSNDS